MASEAIQAAKLRVATAEKSAAAASASLSSANDAVQLAAQMLASAKAQRERAQSEKASSEEELNEAKKHLKAVEEKWEVIDVDLDSDSEGKARDMPGGKENGCPQSQLAAQEKDDESGRRRAGTDDTARSSANNGESNSKGSRKKRGTNDTRERENNVREKRGRRGDAFQIFVKDEHTITLDVTSSDTIRDIKDKIFAKIGTLPGAQFLTYAGKVLEDGRDLPSYNIQKESTLHLRFTPWRARLEIVVRTSAGKSITLDVSPYNSVRDVKAKIQCKEGVEPGRQRLVYRGGLLDDESSLVNCGVSSQATLHLVVAAADSADLPIRVAKLSGQAFTINVTFADTVRQVKSKIEKEEGIPADHQRLIYAGNVLEDDKSMSHYNVQRESKLYLVQTR